MKEWNIKQWWKGQVHSPLLNNSFFGAVVDSHLVGNPFNHINLERPRKKYPGSGHLFWECGNLLRAWHIRLFGNTGSSMMNAVVILKPPTLMLILSPYTSACGFLPIADHHWPKKPTNIASSKTKRTPSKLHRQTSDQPVQWPTCPPLLNQSTSSSDQPVIPCLPFGNEWIGFLIQASKDAQNTTLHRKTHCLMLSSAYTDKNNKCLHRNDQAPQRKYPVPIHHNDQVPKCLHQKYSVPIHHNDSCVCVCVHPSTSSAYTTTTKGLHQNDLVTIPPWSKCLYN